MRRDLFSQMFMLVLMLVVGILIIAQIRTYSRARAQSFSADEEAILLSELVSANRDLRNEIVSLEQQLAAYDQVSRPTILDERVEEMNQVKVANGAIQASGPGIEFTVDGEKQVITESFAAFIPAGIQHGPLIIRNVTKPIFAYSSGSTERYE